MSQFQTCVSNAAYDDMGQMDGGCGDNYSSLAGVDACGQFGGMHDYQQGLLGLTPSYCNQASDYAPVRGMYQATAIPAFAGLQYYPTQVALVNQSQYAPPKIYNVQGQAAVAKNLEQNADAQKFMNQVIRKTDENIKAMQETQAVVQQQIAQQAAIKEKYMNLAQIAAKENFVAGSFTRKNLTNFQ